MVEGWRGGGEGWTARPGVCEHSDIYTSFISPAVPTVNKAPCRRLHPQCGRWREEEMEEVVAGEEEEEVNGGGGGGVGGLLLQRENGGE